MISIIICSRSKDVLKKVSENIEQTIGVPYEIVAIHNERAQLGICQAYNEGALKARYDIYCFMHEDVSFDTQDWGKRVYEHLQNKKIGLLGIAGGDTKSLVPSSWPSYIFECEASFIQHFKLQNKEPERIYKTATPEDPSSSKKVACIDGVWMCTRRDVFEKYQFDEKNLTGFHGYDIDYSLQVLSSYEVYVVFDVLLHHYSEGSFDKVWLNNAIQLSDKWRNKLPYSTRHLSKKELTRQHWTSMNVFIEKMFDLKYNIFYAFTLVVKYSFTHLFRLRYFLYSSKKMLLTYLRKQHYHQSN
jgi:GT2 family glycosyltransferase